MDLNQAKSFFYNYCRCLPGKKDWNNATFVRQLEKLHQNPLIEDFKCSVSRLPLGIQADEFPEDISSKVLAVAVMDLGLSDGQVFDLKDKDTRKFLNETKVENKWNAYSNLYESASYSMLY